MKVTIIGLGKMGSVLAKRLLAAKFDLTIYNRTQEKMQPLIQYGAKAANSIKEAVNEADVVLSCLFDDNAVLTTTQSFLSSLKQGAIHLSTSTILPETSKELAKWHAQQGSVYLAGNVLGVPKAAVRGELTSIIAGDKETIEKCKPILKAYSQQIINVGEKPYQANVVKICMNYLLAANIEAMSELYTFAEKNEVETNVLNILFHSVFAHPAFKLYVDKIKNRQFDEVNFDLKGGYKDISLFEQAFYSVQVAPKIANLIKDKMVNALAHGMENKDWTSFTEITREDANL